MPTISIAPAPRHEVSPRFYMQFMEPLGTTDTSVAACWNVLKDDWREDVIEITRDLAPSSIRWGGILTDFWKWRECVGAPETRVPMVNYLWGGIETNRVGVHEFLDFCERVGAEPIMAVNFAADGRPQYIETPLGEHRAGTPEEAADLVSYCNDAEHPERQAHGRKEPWNIRVWQIGNETSYPNRGQRFTSEENAEHYRTFATAMRERDPSITLIGWGDKERDSDHWWAPELLKKTGDLVDMVAVHMMHQRTSRPDTVLQGRRYRDDYRETWKELGWMYDSVRTKLETIRGMVEEHQPGTRIAITEGHLSLKPHNKNELLREWLSGLYHARVLTLFERHSDIVDICTLADFAGQSWTVNAVMLGSPVEPPYLMPVGHVMRLFSRHSGSHGVEVTSDDDALPVSATRSGDTLYLHVANLDFDKEATVTLDAGGAKLGRMTAHRIAPGDITAAIDTTTLDVFDVETVEGDASGGTITLPAASVSAIEIEIRD